MFGRTNHREEPFARGSQLAEDTRGRGFLLGSRFVHYFISATRALGRGHAFWETRGVSTSCKTCVNYCINFGRTLGRTPEELSIAVDTGDNVQREKIAMKQMFCVLLSLFAVAYAQKGRGFQVSK